MDAMANTRPLDAGSAGANSSFSQQASAPPPKAEPVLFQGAYYGYATLREGGDADVLEQAERAVAGALQGDERTTRMEVAASLKGLDLILRDGRREAHIPLPELRTVSRHRDNKHGKAKVLAIIAVNRRAETNGRGYQCFILRLPATADADRFSEVVGKLCAVKAQELQVRSHREVEEGRLARLPNSPRVCRVGWS